MLELEHSVEQAMRRQLHLIPIDPPPDEVADIAVHYRPLQSVSGDFLDFYQLGDNRFGVAVGDVSGHGIETAIIMGMAKMALRVRSQALGSIHDVVRYANRDLFGELRRTAFVTGAFLAIDRATRRMAYVRAGHPKPILVRAGGDVEELDGGGLPLGIDGGQRFDAALQEREVQLAPGDLVFV
jgi:sigma-B regulation protein RsbU (phosphoserine phosphatase)